MDIEPVSKLGSLLIVRNSKTAWNFAEGSSCSCLPASRTYRRSRTYLTYLVSSASGNRVFRQNTGAPDDHPRSRTPVARRCAMIISAASSGALATVSMLTSACSGGSYGESMPVKFLRFPRAHLSPLPILSQGTWRCTYQGSSTGTSIPRADLTKPLSSVRRRVTLEFTAMAMCSASPLRSPLFRSCK